MTHQPTVDSDGNAPEQPPTSTPNTPIQGAEFYKSEAHRAFEKRDAAKAELADAKKAFADLEAKHNDLLSSKVDAGDEVSKELDSLRAKNQELETKFATAQGAHREKDILSQLTLNVPEENREAVSLMYKTHAKTLDDAEAEPAEVAVKAEALLKQLGFSALFQKQSARTRGLIPSDGGNPRFDAAAAKKASQEKLHDAFPEASGLGL